MKKTDWIWGSAIFIVLALTVIAELPMFLSIILSLAAGGITALIIQSFQNKAAQKEYEKEVEEAKQNFHILFYKECKKNKITNLSSAANKQRAILIGNQMNLVQVTENNVDDYFQRGQDVIKEEEKRRKAEKINAQRNEQQQEENEITNQFKSLYGRDKRIKMINDQLIPLQEGQEAMKTAAFAMMSSAHQEKELDWASMGGAASALGGTAAGISVAAQAQRENENIRARNAANQAAVNRQALSVYESSLSLSSKIDKLEKKLEKAQLALVDDKLTKEALFDQLSITYEIDVDNLGVLSVAANIKLKQKLIIFDNVTAAVDGMLLVEVFLNGKSIGSTLLIVPFEGIHSESKEILVARKMVIPYEDRKKKFTINITPYSLWAIEKA